MNVVEIRKIDDENESLIRKIKVKPGQEMFIETVDECLEEARLHSEWSPVAIYAKDVMIGFAMYGSFGPNKHTWIDRIMIGEEYQGKGYGKMAMKKLIELVTQEYEVNEVYLSIIEENLPAYHFYKSLGFEYINEQDPNGELIFKYTV